MNTEMYLDINISKSWNLWKRVYFLGWDFPISTNFNWKQRMLHAFFLITLKVASSREPCTIETMLLLYLYALRLVMNVSVETNWGKRKRTASVRRLVPETRNRFVVAAGDLRSTKTQNLSHVSSLIGRV